jgi:hypothetical protein
MMDSYESAPPAACFSVCHVQGSAVILANLTCRCSSLRRTYSVDDPRTRVPRRHYVLLGFESTLRDRYARGSIHRAHAEARPLLHRRPRLLLPHHNMCCSCIGIAHGVRLNRRQIG